MNALRDFLAEYTLIKIAIGVVCVAFCVGMIAGKEDPAADEDECNGEVFVATREWKVIKKGQKIPAGLHVRMNLETGLNEAKLLDDGNAKSNAVATVAGNDGSTLLPGVNLEKVKFKSYDEIKSELKDVNLTPKSDAEVLGELLRRHKEDGASAEVLEDLEFLAHQYDNALEFVRMGGFRDVIHRNLNGSDGEAKRRSFVLLGSLAQNNPKVKIHAIETDTLRLVLRPLASGEEGWEIKSAAVYALGSIVRGFPYAQRKMVEGGGLQTLVALINGGSVKVGVKVVTLLNDLVVESRDAQEPEPLKQYGEVDVKARLLRTGYADRLKEFLVAAVKVGDEDGVARCSQALADVGAGARDEL